jgi:hypothetical protein
VNIGQTPGRKAKDLKTSKRYCKIEANADAFEKEWYIDKPQNQRLHHMSLLSPANDASGKSQEM